MKISNSVLNKLVVVLFVLFLVGGKTSFSGKNTNYNANTGKTVQSSEETKPEADTADKTSKKEFDPTKEDRIFSCWQSAYRTYINENSWLESYYANYTLIYLDDDDIPELFFNLDGDMYGDFVLTYYDHRLNILHLYRRSSTFIPRTGLICNNSGHRGYYPVMIYKLSKGEFIDVAFGSTDDAGYPGDEGDFTYEFNGVSLSSREEYNSEINKVYPVKEEVRLAEDEYYRQSEILSILDTGHSSSYGHRYEIVLGDMTWEEAKQACIDKGGYLVTITSPEERKIISEMIESEGKRAYCLFVGYKSEQWLNSDGTTYPEAGWHGLREYSYPGYSSKIPICNELGYGWNYIGLLKYSSETKQVYVFDAPNDLLEKLPHYSWRIGYICEYDR